MLREKRDEERLQEAETLASLDDPVALPYLLQAMDVRDERIVSAVVQALGSFPQAEAADAVIKALHSRSRCVRFAAMRAAGQHIANPGIRDALAECLKSSVRSIRASAIRALSGTDDARIWRLFAGSLRDREPMVRQMAAEALGKTGEPAVVGDLKIALAREGNAEVRSQILASLSKLGAPVKLSSKQEAALLAKQLGSAAVDERVDAARRLGALDPQTALPGIVRALRSPCEHTRWQAVLEVQRLKLKGAAKALEPLVRDPDQLVRMQTAQALVAIGHTEALTLVQPLLTDPSQVVRLAAAGALGMLGDPAAIPALQHALTQEKDPEVIAQFKGVIAHLEKRRGAQARPQDADAR